jgi:hypothetical protein
MRLALPFARSALATCTAAGIAFALALTVPAPAEAQAGKSGDYKVGDRLQGAKGKGAPQTHREISWDALIPKGWDPMAPLRDLKLETLQDGDPRAMRALEKLQEVWSKAPVAPELDNQKVRLPGFIVPLDADPDQIREFLLVPYFGACIHTPPPPSNQVVHVTLDKPLKGMRSMDAVWVNGTMRIGRVETGQGTAGYKLAADTIQPYKF